MNLIWDSPTCGPLDLQARQEDPYRYFLSCWLALATLLALCALSAKHYIDQARDPKRTCDIYHSCASECRKPKPPTAVTPGQRLSLNSKFNSELKRRHNESLMNEPTHNGPPLRSLLPVLPCQSPSPTFTLTLNLISNQPSKFGSFVNHARNPKPQSVSYTTTSTKSTAHTHGEHGDSLRRCPRMAWEGRGIMIREVGLYFSGGPVEKG